MIKYSLYSDYQLTAIHPLEVQSHDESLEDHLFSQGAEDHDGNDGSGADGGNEGDKDDHSLLWRYREPRRTSPSGRGLLSGGGADPMDTALLKGSGIREFSEEISDIIRPQ